MDVKNASIWSTLDCYVRLCPIQISSVHENWVLGEKISCPAGSFPPRMLSCIDCNVGSANRYSTYQSIELMFSRHGQLYTSPKGQPYEIRSSDVYHVLIDETRIRHKIPENICSYSINEGTSARIALPYPIVSTVLYFNLRSPHKAKPLCSCGGESYRKGLKLSDTAQVL